MKLRLTPAQKRFLDTIEPFPECANDWWECDPKELRTALALAKKGLIEFMDTPVKGEFFEVRRNEAYRRLC